MKARSPVLGYNHNIRYAGRLWHVQTEDSGAQNPRIFTHLFHEGTILATKRRDYDAACDVQEVQKLMQTQHKLMLRELKDGAFDEKIGKFFGAPVVREPDEDRTDPHAKIPLGELDLDSTPNPAAQTQPRVAIPPNPPGAPRPPAPRAPVPPISPVAPRAPIVGVGGRRPAPAQKSVPYATSKPTSEGVIVARPAVIVSGAIDASGKRPPPATSAQGPASQRNRSAEPPARPGTKDNIFGGELISEKSLDEVILAYLSEDLNEK